jgi:hypothetical protein
LHSIPFHNSTTVILWGKNLSDLTWNRLHDHL